MSTSNSAAFFEAVENRRTYYGLSDKSSIPDAKIQEIVTEAVKHSPTSFNMQSSRAIVVTGQKNKDMWKMIHESYKNGTGDSSQDERFPGFAAGYGTVLFFEDQDVIDGWIKNMPAFTQAFPVWSGHQTGMLHYVVWTALEKEGLGASLQHYGEYAPSTKSDITKFFGVPESWKNTAMIPFGVPVGGPGNPAHPKTFDKLDERVKVFFAAPVAAASTAAGSNTLAAPVAAYNTDNTTATSITDSTTPAPQTTSDTTPSTAQTAGAATTTAAPASSTPAASTPATTGATSSSTEPKKKTGFMAKLKKAFA